MRVVSCLTLITCLSVSAAGQQPAAPAAKVDAHKCWPPREALGGEAKLAGVKTFVATGRTRQVRDNLLPIEFEIVCELPDKFVRKDEIGAGKRPPAPGSRGRFNCPCLPHLRREDLRAARPPAGHPLEYHPRERRPVPRRRVDRLALPAVARRGRRPEHAPPPSSRTSPG